MTTLTVTVGEAEAIKDRTRERIEAAQAGEDLDDAQPVLDVQSYADLARLFAEANLELLAAIAANEPESMRETATLVGRDFKEVHRNLTELETLGVIELEAKGRAKRPVVQYDEIEVAIDLDDATDVSDRPASA